MGKKSSIIPALHSSKASVIILKLQISKCKAQGQHQPPGTKCKHTQQNRTGSHLVRVLHVTLEGPQIDRWIGVLLASEGCLWHTMGTRFGIFAAAAQCFVSHFLKASGQQGRPDAYVLHISMFRKYVENMFYIFSTYFRSRIFCTYFLHISYIFSTYFLHISKKRKYVENMQNM